MEWGTDIIDSMVKPFFCSVLDRYTGLVDGMAMKDLGNVGAFPA